MGCNCGGGVRVGARPVDNTLGYQVTLPDGTKMPPDGEPPFFSLLEARTEQRRAGGGTIRRLTKKPDAK